ncbi:hypothetical protein PC41400_28540 [Paenibacillus chitinolyticus]|uniref:Uncharacterized protein n=1 Tax=Paenibacillus chitinolyticus TaxID=79263 RepID=A0A410X478_9BACL|nr:hypothetical protein [Paenibacillus chitinolyticus]MCY9592239.1 hypothetical protein [Paenibacillus chitinolyticus]MCY9598066.1 hypothetical protein [Paenibacillus chitinolyticus]QAV21407.1 hypothetical protein PC41400_28540 [Paenibacillus chitinolyticus]
MTKKTITGIAALAAVVISSTVVYAANTTTVSVPTDTARSFTEKYTDAVAPEASSKPVPYKEFSDSRVYSKLESSWTKAVQALHTKASKEANQDTKQPAAFAQEQWNLIAGPDIEAEFESKLSRNEASSFNEVFITTTRGLKPGDLMYALLLKGNKTEAKVVWQRANGDIHVSHLRQSKDLHGNIVWSLLGSEEIASAE